MNTARPTNTLRRTMLIGSSALLLTALLTGCGAANGDLGALIPTAPTDQATEAAKPAAIPGDTDGNGRLSEFEKQILAAHAPKDYTMPDASVVQIDPTQPLPAPVVAAIQAKAAPLGAAVKYATGETIGTTKVDIKNLVDAEAPLTGRGIVFVLQGQTLVDPSSRETKTVWFAVPSVFQSTGIPVNEDQAAFLAAVNAWASPRDYAVIVIG